MAQADLSSFRSRQQVASSRDKMAAEQNAALALETRTAELDADRKTFNTLLVQLKTGDAAAQSEALRALATSPAMTENAAVGNLYRQLLIYQDRLDSMTTGPWRASASNPDVIQVKALAGSTEKNLVDAVSSHVKSLDARIDALGGLKQRSASSMEVLPAMAEEENRLNRRVDALAGLGDGLRKDYQRARMSEAVEAGDVDVVDLADVPYAPLLTASAIKLALGVVLGLLLGLVLAYLLEALNTSIRRPEDLEAVLHIPGLAVIPRITSGSGKGRSRLRGLLGGGKSSPQNRLAHVRRADVLDRHRGVPQPPDEPDLVGWGRGPQDAGRHQRRTRRGQDPHRRQSRRDPRLRRAPGPARGLRYPPPAGARAVPLPRSPGLMELLTTSVTRGRHGRAART